MRRLGIIAGTLVAIVVLLVVGVRSMLDANRYKPALESELSKVLGRDVKVAALDFSIFSGNISAAGITISDDAGFGSNPFLQAKSLRAGAEVMPLIFSHRLNVTGITIDNPEILLLQSPSGAWNFSTLGTTKNAAQPPAATTPAQAQPGTSAMDLSVRSININKGRLTVGHIGSNRKPLVLEPVDIVVKNFSSTSQFPFSLSAKVAGGGDITLDGNAGPIHSSDASMTPFGLMLKINALDLASSGLNSMAPDLAGIVSLDGMATSDGNTLKIDGHLKAEALKLVKNGRPSRIPVELDFSDEHALRKNSGTIQRAALHIGKSEATLTGTYRENGDSLELRTNVTGSGMAATDLAAILPSLGLSLPAGSTVQSGTLNVKLDSEGPADKLVTSGSVAMSNVRLAGFNLGQKMAAVESLAGMKSSPDMDVQTASTNIRMAPDGIAAQNIQFTVSGFGAMTGNGTISPNDALNFKMNANVQGPELSRTLGNLSVPFTVEGSTANPVFRPDINALAKTQIKKAETKALGSVLNNLLGGKKP